MKNNHSGEINLWLLILICLGGMSCSLLFLRMARHSDSILGMKSAAIALGIFFLPIAFILMHKATQYDIKRREKLHKLKMNSLDINKPYIARYDRQEGWVMLCLSIFSLSLAIKMYYDNKALSGLLLFLPLFALFGIWRAADIFSTSITFTNNRIIAKSLFFTEISEPYSNISRIAYRLRSIILTFSNGQVLKMRDGLGNAEIYTMYLEKYGPSSVIDRWDRESLNF